MELKQGDQIPEWQKKSEMAKGHQLQQWQQPSQTTQATGSGQAL